MITYLVMEGVEKARPIYNKLLSTGLIVKSTGSNYVQLTHKSNNKRRTAL